MKNYTVLIVFFLSIFIADDWIKIERQRSKDPEFNGLFFECKIEKKDIENGYVRFFLTKDELSKAWEK